MYFKYHPIFIVFLTLYFIQSASSSEILRIPDESPNNDTETVVIRPIFSIYQERYRNNKITGFMLSGRNTENSSALRLHLFIGAKLESLQSSHMNEKPVYKPTIDYGVGFYFGHKLFTYSYVGFDLGEIMMSELFTNDESAENIDIFFSTGLGFKVNSIGLDFYVKLNSISGSDIESHNKIYSGIKTAYYF